MKRISSLVVALALAACVKDKPTQWHGIPTDGAIACGEIQHGVATCIAGGRVFACVFVPIGGEGVHQWDATCAPIAAPLPAEDEPRKGDD